MAGFSPHCMRIAASGWPSSLQINTFCFGSPFPGFHHPPPLSDVREITTPSIWHRAASSSIFVRLTERSTERSTDRSTERSTEPSTVRSTERSTERSNERSTDRSVDRTVDQSTDRSTIRSTDQWNWDQLVRASHLGHGNLAGDLFCHGDLSAAAVFGSVDTVWRRWRGASPPFV